MAGGGRYEPGLDGVRALAVAAVLAFHDGRLHGGFLGVSTFFTLSGFLITRLLVRQWRQNRGSSLRSFYARRLRRLVPAAVAGVLLAAAVAVALHDAQTSHNFPLDGLAALGNVANWRFLASGQSYANLFATTSPLQHFWSLAVEEQFYLVLAPLIVGMLMVFRGRRVPMLAAVGALGAISFVDGWLSSAHGIDRAYYGTDTRSLEFLVGSVLAIALSGRKLNRSAARVFGIAGPFALLAMVWANAHARVGDRVLFRGGLLAYGCLGGLVLLAACVPGPVGKLCNLAPLRALGRVSYGVYVFHWPIFLWLSAARTGLSPVPLTTLRLAVTFSIAAISYVFLEQPIRERRALTGRRRWIALPTAGCTAAACAALVGVVASTPAVTFAATASPSEVLAAAQLARRVPVSTQSSAPGRRTGSSTSTSSPRRVQRVMVVGDSVALTLGRGIERWGAHAGVYVLNGGALGCTLVDGVEVRGYWGVLDRPADSCNTHETWPKTLAAFRPDVVVVLFGAWDVYDVSLDHGRTWLSPGQPEWNRYYRGVVAETRRRLAATGARIVWLEPPCFSAKPGAADAGAAWYDRARIDAISAVDRAVAAAGGMTVSPVVHDLGCPVDFGARPDGVHYSDAGADATATRLAPVISRFR